MLNHLIQFNLTPSCVFFQLVGRFRGATQLYNPSPGISIVWPTTKPEDMPPCGFNGELCIPARGRLCLILCLLGNYAINLKKQGSFRYFLKLFVTWVVLPVFLVFCHVFKINFFEKKFQATAIVNKKFLNCCGIDFFL